MNRVCPTCPYKWVIAQRISMRTHLKRKEVDDVLGGKDSWANVDVVDGESMISDTQQRIDLCSSSSRSKNHMSRDIIGIDKRKDIELIVSHLPGMR